MGSKKKKSSKPPVIQAPQPSAQELALLQQQADLTAQMAQQGRVTSENALKDRESALGILEMLKVAPQLSTSEQELINQMADAYYNQAMKAITEGQNKEIFDTSKRDNIIGLSSQGILNSTFGAEVLGGLEKERQRLIAKAGDDAALQKLGLTGDFLQRQVAKNMDLFQTLYSGSGQSGNYSAAMLGNAAQAAGNVADDYKANRMDAFSTNIQNAQAQYAYQQQQALRGQQKKGVFGGIAGGIGGAAIGTLFGNPLLGAAIGSGAGYGLGSIF